MTVEQLAEKAVRKVDCGDLGHMILTIKFIEGKALSCPSPRKSYEWKALAQALKCSINEIMED